MDSFCERAHVGRYGNKASLAKKRNVMSVTREEKIDPFYFENNFYLTCDPSRIGKFIAHYRMFEMTLDVPGAIVECGVFKGVSLARFAMMRKMLLDESAKKIIGFDVFGKFPEAGFEGDKLPREKFLTEAGDQSVSVDELYGILREKGCGSNLELVAGDACETIPEYAGSNPELRISLLHLDVDLYEPSVATLEHFWDRLSPGGILIIDDYERFPGETKAVDDFFKDNPQEIHRFDFCQTPVYIRKKG